MKPFESIARAFAEINPEGVARTLEGFEPEDAARVLDELPAEIVGPVVARLVPYAAATILGHVAPERRTHLLASITARQAAAVLRSLDEEKREAALAALPEPVARSLRRLLKHRPDSAGGMMDTEVTSIAIDLTAGEAIAVLRKAPRQTLFYLYVTDRDGKLGGVLTMRDLLLAKPQDPVEPIVRREVTSVPASMDREEVATLMRQRRFIALPVVDEAGLLLGVVRHDRVIDAAQQEAFEDLQRMVGAGGDERALSSVGTVVRKRLPWLCVNLATAFIAAGVVALFEGIIAQVTALAVLLPIVAGQGGNTGAQALAVVMRGLALREIVPGAVRRVVIKEGLGGVLNGIVIAALCAAAAGSWYASPGLGVVIGLAMIVNMAAATLAGATIPLVLRALGRDPAQSSSIFLTTVTDVVGLGSFLGFAVVFKPMLV